MLDVRQGICISSDDESMTKSCDILVHFLRNLVAMVGLSCRVSIQLGSDDCTFLGEV